LPSDSHVAYTCQTTIHINTKIFAMKLAR